MADIKIYGTLHSDTTDGVIATADQVKDPTFKDLKSSGSSPVTQHDINKKLMEYISNATPVSTSSIEDKAITTAKLADKAITAEKLADAVVTEGKLSSDVSNKLVNLQKITLTSNTGSYTISKPFVTIDCNPKDSMIAATVNVNFVPCLCTLTSTNSVYGITFKYNNKNINIHDLYGGTNNILFSGTPDDIFYILITGTEGYIIGHSQAGQITDNFTESLATDNIDGDTLIPIYYYNNADNPDATQGNITLRDLKEALAKIQ